MLIRMISRKRQQGVGRKQGGLATKQQQAWTRRRRLIKEINLPYTT